LARMVRDEPAFQNAIAERLESELRGRGFRVGHRLRARRSGRFDGQA
jgi:hypothetical protein